MAPDIVFNYEWLWGDYTADVTFTKKLLGDTPVSALSVIPGAYKTMVSSAWSGTYTKQYSGKTTYDIIKQVMTDIKQATDEHEGAKVTAATGAIKNAQKASRAVNNSAAKEAVRHDNKAMLAYMLTNFCGYKKTITATSLKGSLRAQTKSIFNSTKLITPGREGACNVLDEAYRAKSQIYPEKTAITAVIENKTVAGKEINNKAEYDRIYAAGEQSKWGAKGGMRRTRKNRK